MTDETSKRQSTDTTTVTEERAEDGDKKEGTLTPEEEKAVRMRHGLSEEDDHELKFGLGADEEVLAKLANLEKFLVEKLRPTEKLEGVFDGARVDLEAKRQIVDKLKEADD